MRHKRFEAAYDEDPDGYVGEDCFSPCDIAGCDKPYSALVMADDTEIQVCEDHRWV